MSLQTQLRKFVVIGPESTGKSTLCEGLAAHFGTRWVPEYAREYLLSHGKTYQYEDLLTIAKGQIALEDTIAAELAAQPLTPSTPPQSSDLPSPSASLNNPSNNPSFPARHQTTNLSLPDTLPLFIDTDMYVMKVWGEFVYGKCDPWILDQIATRKYDGYLLCRTDLPWAPDELREYPDLTTREQLFHIYRDALINQATPWAEIDGLENERLEKAIRVIGDLSNW